MNRSGFIHELWHEDDVALPPAADAENFEAPIASGVLQGAADLVTTAGDIDKWLTALRQKTLLSEESYAEMTQDYSPDDGKYGYGLMLHMPNGIGHTGMLSAYTSLAYTRPDKGYNFFAVSNNKASIRAPTRATTFLPSATTKRRSRTSCCSWRQCWQEATEAEFAIHTL